MKLEPLANPLNRRSSRSVTLYSGCSCCTCSSCCILAPFGPYVAEKVMFRSQDEEVSPGEKKKILRGQYGKNMLAIVLSVLFTIATFYLFRDRFFYAFTGSYFVLLHLFNPEANLGETTVRLLLSFAFIVGLSLASMALLLGVCLAF